MAMATTAPHHSYFKGGWLGWTNEIAHGLSKQPHLTYTTSAVATSAVATSSHTESRDVTDTKPTRAKTSKHQLSVHTNTISCTGLPSACIRLNGLLIKSHTTQIIRRSSCLSLHNRRGEQAQGKGENTAFRALIVSGQTRVNVVTNINT